MWELYYQESWVLENWCFWTVVLEKTLESPLDCKEIQPVHPKGSQSWIFIGRTDVEAETLDTLATWCEEPTYLKWPWCWGHKESDTTEWLNWTCNPMDCSTPGYRLSPTVCSNSCPLSQWCHPSNHLILCFPFSSCPQSLPALGSFPVSQLFTSGGQSIRASESESVLPMNIQDLFHSGLTSFISLLFKELSRVFSSSIVQKH